MYKTLLVLALAGIFGTSSLAQAENAWSAEDYDLYAGDFNGDGLADVLYIAHDLSHFNGIALSDGAGFNIALQSWGNAYLGIPWSSGKYNIVVADFDGDGRDDLFLQRRSAGDHYLLLTEDGCAEPPYLSVWQCDNWLAPSAQFLPHIAHSRERLLDGQTLGQVRGLAAA